MKQDKISNEYSPLVGSINAEKHEGHQEVSVGLLEGLRISLMRKFLALMVFVGLSIVYILRINLSVAIIPMSSDFNWNDSFQSVILSSFFWGYVPVQVAGGLCATRYGGKITLAFGIVGASVFTTILPFLTTDSEYRDYLILLSRVFTGLCEGVTYPTVHNMASRWFGESERASYIAFMWSGSFAGVCIADAVSPNIISAFGWKYVFIIFGGLAAPWFLVWFIFSSDGPELSRWVSLDELKNIQDDQKEPVRVERDEKIPWGIFFSSAGVWAIIINSFCGNWSFYTNLMWLPTYMKDELHYSLDQSGINTFLPTFVQFLTMMISSRITDRIIHRKIIDPTRMRKVIFILSGMLPPIIQILLCFNLEPRVYVILLMLSGGLGGIAVANSTNHMDLSPKFAGILYGIGNTASSIPGITATLFVGQILQRWDCWCAVWAMASIIGVCGTIFYLIFGTAKPLNIPDYKPKKYITPDVP